MKKDDRTTWRIKASSRRAQKASVRQKERAQRHWLKFLQKSAWEKARAQKLVQENSILGENTNEDRSNA